MLNRLSEHLDRRDSSAAWPDALHSMQASLLCRGYVVCAMGRKLSLDFGQAVAQFES